MHYIILPNFEIHVHEALRPLLREIPFVLQVDNKVFKVNDLAKKSGVSVGMSLREAKKVCFGLQFLKPSQQKYFDFSKRFYTLLSKFTKTVEPIGPSEAFFDYPPYHAKDKEEILYSLLNLISKDLEIPVRIGSGTNKTVAELAGNLSDKQEVLVVEKMIEKEFIKSLPISMLPGIGKRTGALLYGMNIKTIGSFTQLPKEKIMGLFGPAGQILYQIAHGNDCRKIAPPQEQKTITRSIQLSKPSLRKEYVTTMLHYACQSALNDLQQRQLGAKQLTVQVELISGVTKQRTRKIPTNSSFSLLERAQRLEEEIIRTVSEPIRLIRIRFSELEPKTNSAYFFGQLTKLVEQQSAKATKMLQSNLFTPSLSLSAT